VLLHFGWDWHLKGGDLFLGAVRRLLDDARWRHRTLLAVTSQGGEPARTLAADLGLSDHVRIVGPIDDVETLHAAADVLLATSRAEGDPLAVAEALSRGTPVVATEIPGHTYAAEATPACRLVPHDPAAIAKAAVQTLDRSAQSARADAGHGHEWIRQERSMSAWVERLLGFYEEALERRGHPGDAPASRASA
jgi:glycosyltransferase involved in cell wall biosynthesis